MNSLDSSSDVRRFTVLFLLVSTFTASALDLVKDGQPVATIVTTVSPEAFAVPSAKPVKGAKRAAALAPAEAEEAAAVKLLVEWVRKITDAELPVAQQAPAGAPAIYVGKAALAAGLKLDDIASPSLEGVRISADAQRVLIAGQSEGATYKAVARFLEELGCRVFMDGPLGEVFPRSKTLSVGALAITEKPGLHWRNPKGPSWRSPNWRQWNGAGGDAIGHSHSWGYFPKETFDQHPEWFALGADGQRKPGSWLCTSNPEMRKAFAARLCEVIAGGSRNPSISPPDGRGYCQCGPCKAQDDPSVVEPSSGTVSISNRYADFFDAVGRLVAAVHPDSILSFYCYADYTQPPTFKRKLSPNLCAVIAPIRYCRLHEIGHPGCTSREQAVKMIEGWAAIASRIGYYNYMYNLADATLPFFKFTACEKEFPWLHARGLTHMTLEMLSNWHIYGPQMHLSLRLAYDPKADAKAIMEDYWLKFYGPKAAPHMKEYWMGIDAALGRLESHAGCFFGLQQIYTPEFMKQCAARLAEAATAARGDATYEQRVALHTEGFKSAMEYRAISDGLNRGDFAGALKQLDTTSERLVGLAGKGWVNSEYHTSYLNRFLRKTVVQGAALLAPPNQLLQVLPDQWRFAFDEADRGNELGFPNANFDDAKWATVSTLNRTLDSQGFDRNTVFWYRTKFTMPATAGTGKHSLFFGEVDGASEVYVNGKRVDIVWPAAPATAPGKAVAKKPAAKAAAPAVAPKPAVPSLRDGQAKGRQPFEVDVSAAVKPGENVVALRVDHSRITELSLGGILRPVLLVKKGE